MEFNYVVKIEDIVLNELPLEEIETEARKEFATHLAEFMRGVKIRKRALSGDKSDDS